MYFTLQLWTWSFYRRCKTEVLSEVIWRPEMGFIAILLWLLSWWVLKVLAIPHFSHYLLSFIPYFPLSFVVISPNLYHKRILQSWLIFFHTLLSRIHFYPALLHVFRKAFYKVFFYVDKYLSIYFKRQYIYFFSKF